MTDKEEIIRRTLEGYVNCLAEAPKDIPYSAEESTERSAFEFIQGIYDNEEDEKRALDLYNQMKKERLGGSCPHC